MVSEDIKYVPRRHILIQNMFLNRARELGWRHPLFFPLPHYTAHKSVAAVDDSPEVITALENISETGSPYTVGSDVATPIGNLACAMG